MSTVIAASALLCAVPAFDRIDFGSLSMFWLGAVSIGLAAGIGGSQFEHFVHAGLSVNTWLLPAVLILFAVSAAVLQLMRNSHLAKAIYVQSLNGFYVNEAGCTALWRPEVSRRLVGQLEEQR